MSIVGSVRLDRVWESKARVNFVALTGESAPKELEACVRGLERHVEKTVPEANRLQCDVCGGWSDEGLKSCPYCADEGPPAEELFPAIATRRRKVSSGTATNEGSGGGEDMARIRQDGTVVEKPKLEPCPIIHVEKISTPDPNPGLERLASQWARSSRHPCRERRSKQRSGWRTTAIASAGSARGRPGS